MPVKPLAPITIKAIHELTYAELDEVYDLTGVDIAEKEVRMSHRMLALEFWARRKAGQDVTYEQVRQRGSIARLTIDTGDEQEGPKENGSAPG